MAEILIGEDDDGAKHNNQFLLTATLEAGVGYVYRISFYEDREGSVPAKLSGRPGCLCHC